MLMITVVSPTLRIAAAMLVGTISVLIFTPASADEKWGDIPADQLAGKTLADFVIGTPKEEETKGILRLLDLDIKQPILAVFWIGGSESTIPENVRGAEVIMDGCSITLDNYTRSVSRYSGIGRDDAQMPKGKAVEKERKEDAIAKARELGTALGVDLKEVETRAKLDGAIWRLDFYQLYKGFFCPGNVFTVDVNGHTMAVRLFVKRPFMTSVDTAIKIDKSTAISKALGIVKASRAEYKGKVVKGNITIDRPWVYAVSDDTDSKGEFKGMRGKLAWPVYIDGSGLIIYIDCETGEPLGSTE